MFRGRNKAISGKKYKIKITRMIDGTNIAAPLKISPKLNSFTAPANTKQFIPTGGVSMPISIIKTIITPNQMRSAPNGSDIGQTGARGDGATGLLSQHDQNHHPQLHPRKISLYRL